MGDRQVICGLYQVPIIRSSQAVDDTLLVSFSKHSLQTSIDGYVQQLSTDTLRGVATQQPSLLHEVTMEEMTSFYVKIQPRTFLSEYASFSASPAGILAYNTFYDEKFGKPQQIDEAFFASYHSIEQQKTLLARIHDFIESVEKQFAPPQPVELFL